MLAAPTSPFYNGELEQLLGPSPIAVLVKIADMRKFATTLKWTRRSKALLSKVITSKPSSRSPRPRMQILAPDRVRASKFTEIF